ncbi:MAG: alpha/beta hydrolase, partial [Opitutaceae bacterium]
AQPRVIPLWTDGAPGFERFKDVPEQAHDYWVRNVNDPSISVFAPPLGKANGCAVVVAPGGGFRELVFKAEGRQPSEFLNTLGVTAFALKYRLPNEANSPYTMRDARAGIYRAMRFVRYHAHEFGIDPNRIGVLGFSAGGVLAMDVAFRDARGDPAAPDPIDRVSARPDFERLIYPGGDDLPAAVPRDSGPAFLLCANDDQYHCDEVTLRLLEELRVAEVSVEAHFMAQGKHGFNMGDRSQYLAIRHWPDRMADWLKDRGLLRGAGTPAASKPGRRGSGALAFAGGSAAVA